MLAFNLNVQNLFWVRVTNTSHKLGKPTVAVLDIHTDVFMGGSVISTWPDRKAGFNPGGEFEDPLGVFIWPWMIDYYGSTNGEIVVTVKGPQGQLVATFRELFYLPEVAPAPAPAPIAPISEPTYLSSPSSSQVLSAVQQEISDGSYDVVVVTDGPWGFDSTVHTESIAAAAEYSGMSVADWGSYYGFW